MENLKQQYMEEVKKVWKTERMQKYCESQFFGAVEISDGLIVKEKEKVRTRFCYGEDGGESYNIALNNCEAVSSKFDVFLRENLKYLDRDIEEIKQMIKEVGQTAWIKRAFIGNNYEESDKLKFFVILYTGRENGYSAKVKLRQATKEDLFKILDLYMQFRADRIKKCKAYWKRFGGSKLHTWTYWENA